MNILQIFSTPIWESSLPNFQDHKDDRYKELFNYVAIPEDCDLDFTEIQFEEFLKFLVDIKKKEPKKKTTKKKK